MSRAAQIALLLTISLTVHGADSPPSGEAADAAAIKAVLDAHGTAWTRGDAEAATAILTEDADWVSGSGKVFIGRPAIAKMHRDLLSGPAKGTQHSHPGVPNIRFVTRDVAIVDGDSYMAGFHDEDGKELPAELSRYTAVFVKKNGGWYVTAFRSLPQIKVTRPQRARAGFDFRHCPGAPTATVSIAVNAGHPADDRYCPVDRQLCGRDNVSEGSVDLRQRVIRLRAAQKRTSVVGSQVSA